MHKLNLISSIYQVAFGLCASIAFFAFYSTAQNKTSWIVAFIVGLGMAVNGLKNIISFIRQK